MAFKQAASIVNLLPKRAALYLRVSTGRQAAGDVSIPSQRELTRAFCEQQGWVIVDEFVEPGASATDDRRPVFQRMLDEAVSGERRFDVICVHSFSRFFRNGAEMELTIRRLKKHGVDVVSMTQPTGDDPSQELMRQIIGVFDEYTSKENGKNVSRAMRESAKQGFWNGATPPLGYKIVEAERRGSKIKKKLAIDPVEAETVRLIYQLYLEGDGRIGPLGIKELTKWLNKNGHRTRRGSTFGVGPLHKILTNSAYATGKWPYGVRNSRTGAQHDPSTVIEIEIPAIVPLETFEAVQARLAERNPKVTPPRVTNGPTLLTGLAVCASCGAGMTRTGTVRRGRSYTYYSCAGCHQKGKTVCKGRHVPVAKLDKAVLDNVRDQLFVPDRIKLILEGLLSQQQSKNDSVESRRLTLQSEIQDKTEKLARLYKAIEEGIVDLDADLKARIQALKTEREIAQASLERIVIQMTQQVTLTPERVDAFATLMRTRLEQADTQEQKAYLRAVLDRIEVGDETIRIYGDKDVLAAAIAGQQTAAGKVRGFVRKWRARKDSNL